MRVSLWMLTILFYIIGTIFRGFVFYSFKSTPWSMQPSLFVFTLYALSSPMSNGLNLIIIVFWYGELPLCHPFLYARLRQDVLWYSVVCPSVCLSGPCRLQDLTTWYFWSAWWEEDAYCYSRSEVKGKGCFCHIHVVGKHGRIHYRQDTDWTSSFRIIQLGTNGDHHDEMKMPFVFQGRIVT